jgi:hypothetical protein
LARFIREKRIADEKKALVDAQNELENLSFADGEEYYKVM